MCIRDSWRRRHCRSHRCWRGCGCRRCDLRRRWRARRCRLRVCNLPRGLRPLDFTSFGENPLLWRSWGGCAERVKRQRVGKSAATPLTRACAAGLAQGDAVPRTTRSRGKPRTRVPRRRSLGGARVRCRRVAELLVEAPPLAGLRVPVLGILFTSTLRIFSVSAIHAAMVHEPPLPIFLTLTSAGTPADDLILDLALADRRFLAVLISAILRLASAGIRPRRGRRFGSASAGTAAIVTRRRRWRR